MTVYIPTPNAKLVLGHMYDAINKQTINTHPDSFHHCWGLLPNKPENVLPRFYQHVKSTPRGKNTLDHVYTNIKDPYRVKPQPSNSAQPISRMVKVWPEGAISQLHYCFEHIK